MLEEKEESNRQQRGGAAARDEKIPKGTMTWRFDPRFDLLFDPKEVETWPEQEKKFIETYAYCSPQSGEYVLSVDDSRFTNHSSRPNIDNGEIIPGDTETFARANRDIEVGEELTIDYRKIDVSDATSDEEYLNR